MVMVLIRALPIVVAAASLAGCSGGGGAGASVPVSIGPDPDGGGGALGGGGNPLSDTSLTDPRSLPAVGSAVYSGLMALGIEAVGNAAGTTTPYAGALTLTARFADSSITGQVTDIATGANPAAIGTLYLTLGQIDRAASGTNHTFDGLLSGTLQEGANAYLLHGGFAGDFVGVDAAEVKGTVAGQTIRSGRTSNFRGAFRAD
jgi:hypothetical protein